MITSKILRFSLAEIWSKDTKKLSLLDNGISLTDRSCSPTKSRAIVSQWHIQQTEFWGKSTNLTAEVGEGERRDKRTRTWPCVSTKQENTALVHNFPLPVSL